MVVLGLDGKLHDRLHPVKLHHTYSEIERKKEKETNRLKRQKTIFDTVERKKNCDVCKMHDDVHSVKLR